MWWRLMSGLKLRPTGKGKDNRKSNRRSFDSVARRYASHFAQDDRLVIGPVFWM